jgi:ADP-heptose:LPS heptosyltransferase
VKSNMTIEQCGLAVLLFPDGSESFVKAFPLIRGLKAKFSRLIILGSAECEALANLSGCDDFRVVSVSAFQNVDALLDTVMLHAEPGCEFFNVSQNVVCGELLSNFEQGGIIVNGFVWDGKWRGSNTLADDLLFKFNYGMYPNNSSLVGKSIRYALACICEVEPILNDRQKPSQGELILICLEGSSSTAKYPDPDGLINLLQKDGYEVQVVREQNFEQLTLIVDCASAVIAVESTLLALAVDRNIPALGLLSIASSDDWDLKCSLRSQQPCYPCYSQECVQARVSCLEDLSPRRIVQQFKKLVEEPCNLALSRSWVMKSYIGQKIAIFCYHGLGDALRFAVPLATAFGRAGAEVILNVRQELISCIGKNPDISLVSGVGAEYIESFPNATIAAEALLTSLGKCDLYLVLGACSFDKEMAKVIQAKGYSFWGKDCLPSSEYFRSTQFWVQKLEIYKGRDLLFSLFGLTSIALNERLIFPLDSEKPSLIEGLNRVGVHTIGMWKSKCYPHRERLIELLKDKYEVWNFDQPKGSIASLAWTILASKAVVTVDTMVLHLCNALGVPVLLIQGPVWHHTDHASFVIEETRTEVTPRSLCELSTEGEPLGVIVPELIANKFIEFVEGLA